MSQTALGIFGLFIVFVFVFLGMPVWSCFLLIGMAGIVYVRGLDQGLISMGLQPYASMNQYFWTVVPLFVFMGYLTLNTDLAAEFYTGCRNWLGHIKGGLAIAIIVAMTAFGAACGTPVGAAVTFTALTLPELRRFKYEDTFTLSCIAGGGLLSSLIPPSMSFIVFGSLTSTSIGKLFIAGIIPGFVMAGLYIILIGIRVWRNPTIAPALPAVPMGQRTKGSIGLWALSAIFIIIIGGLYIGMFTPTESGAMGSFIVIVLGLIRRKLGWTRFKKAFRESATSTGMVGLLLIGTMSFNLFLVMTNVPGTIANAVVNAGLGHWGTMLLVIGTLFILGMFMDGLAMALLTIPIFFPIVTKAGWDPIHYAICNTIMGGIGGLTPPFGMVVFAIVGTAKDVPMGSVFKAIRPVVAANFIGEAIMLSFPALALWLPNKMIS